MDRVKALLPYIVVLALLLAAPMLVSRFYVYILTVIFVTALLAMSLNMVVGHGGLYQFHHAAFYGIGAYTFALLLTRTSVPFWVAFLSGPIMATVFGAIIGWFCVRLSKLYFGMLQISLGSLLWAIVFRWYDLTHGDDGIHGIPLPDWLFSSKTIYYTILGVLVLCLFLMHVILKSPFGATMLAIRDNPDRCEAIGIHVRRHQLLAIMVATFFAGVAGVLYVILKGSVFPDLMFWTLSLEVFIMCLLGGWFTFAGPMLGAVLMVALQTFVSPYTDYWTLILGVILILLIFFLPEGVMGFLSSRFTKRSNSIG